MFDHIHGLIKRLISQPVDEMGRWQRALRYGYELSRYGARQLRHDRAQHMAAALAFRTLFGLLPVLVVATVLVNSLAGMDQFMQAVDDLFAFAGLNDVHLILPSNNSSLTTESVALSSWLKELLGQAANINLAAIGWVGLVVMLYAAISLMVTIENCFNVIYRAPGGRPWLRRIPLYWFVLTISPLALAVSMYVNTRFNAWIDSVEAWQWLLHTAKIVWSLAFTWLFMFSFYSLFPNTAVTPRAAAIGGMVAVLLLEIGKRSLGAYLEHAFTISQLYGSLGLIPLFMFWVYLMWLVVLFGLEVAAVLQALPGERLDQLEERRETHGIVDPASVVVIMEIIGERFARGEFTNSWHISDSTGIPPRTVQYLFDALIKSGFLHRVSGSEDAVTLSCPADQISGQSLLDVAYQLAELGRSARPSSFMERLRSSQRGFASECTLSALISERLARQPVRVE